MLIFFNTFFFVCQSQMKEKLGKGTVSLEKIIFHSRGLTTYLPKTDFMIDSDRNIKEAREFYLKGARTGKHYFGYFNGHLKKNEYAKLIELLETCNLDSMKFPAKECCDGIITTMIIYYNGQRKYFRSMTPPPEAEKLILFLNYIGTYTKLKKTKNVNNFEE